MPVDLSAPGSGALDLKLSHTINCAASQAFTLAESHHPLSWHNSLQMADLGLGLHNREGQFLS